jgi:hypothetical protein
VESGRPGGEERKGSGDEAGLRLGGKEERMEKAWNAWTVTVAGGDGTELRAAEALIRDVVTASRHNPGVVFYVPELFLREVFRTAQERAEKGDSLAQRFFEGLEKVELRASREGRLAEKYQVELGLGVEKVMEDLILLAKEVSPRPDLYIPKGVLEDVKREVLVRAKKGDALALELLERIGEITFTALP